MSGPNDPVQLSTFFDYESLDRAQRQVIQEHTGEIRKRLRRSAQDVWEIGQRLADVRSRLKYGQFLTWLKAEFGWSQRTAYNFINVYETFGDRFAKLAKVDIATSVLYQLAAPSVPEELRTEVLQAAASGQKITHKSIKSAIKQSKQTTNTASIAPETQEPAVKKPEIITVIPKSVELANPSRAAEPEPELEITAGWYQLGAQHLFCGDTATPSFVNAISQAKLAIAVTAEDWAHDWLIDQVDSVVVLPQEKFTIGTLKELLGLLSRTGDTVVFPWLPLPEMIATAHSLGRLVYAGDPSKQRCQRAIAATGLQVQPLASEPAVTLAG
ncbi:MAG: DUF3102 domain-containing protein [Leptolyngbya sp. SIOISBB]|nr:DUF3102 domain-containing protein [Leptolyngbya sp. SIOISBB]